MQLMQVQVEGLKANVQSMLEDFTLLLQYANSSKHKQQQHPSTASSSSNSNSSSGSNRNSNGSTRGQRAAESNYPAEDARRQSDQSPQKAATRRSAAAAMSSLISSIDRLNRGFAECKVGKVDVETAVSSIDQSPAYNYSVIAASLDDVPLGRAIGIGAQRAYRASKEQQQPDKAESPKHSPRSHSGGSSHSSMGGKDSAACRQACRTQQSTLEGSRASKKGSRAEPVLQLQLVSTHTNGQAGAPPSMPSHQAARAVQHNNIAWFMQCSSAVVDDSHPDRQAPDLDAEHASPAMLGGVPSSNGAESAAPLQNSTCDHTPAASQQHQIADVVRDDASARPARSTAEQAASLEQPVTLTDTEPDSGSSSPKSTHQQPPGRVGLLRATIAAVATECRALGDAIVLTAATATATASMHSAQHPICSSNTRSSPTSHGVDSQELEGVGRDTQRDCNTAVESLTAAAELQQEPSVASWAGLARRVSGDDNEQQGHTAIAVPGMEAGQNATTAAAAITAVPTGAADVAVTQMRQQDAAAAGHKGSSVNQQLQQHSRSHQLVLAAGNCQQPPSQTAGVISTMATHCKTTTGKHSIRSANSADCHGSGGSFGTATATRTVARRVSNTLYSAAAAAAQGGVLAAAANSVYGAGPLTAGLQRQSSFQRGPLKRPSSGSSTGGTVAAMQQPRIAAVIGSKAGAAAATVAAKHSASRGRGRAAAAMKSMNSGQAGLEPGSAVAVPHSPQCSNSSGSDMVLMGSCNTASWSVHSSPLFTSTQAHAAFPAADIMPAGIVKQLHSAGNCSVAAPAQLVNAAGVQHSATGLPAVDLGKEQPDRCLTELAAADGNFNVTVKGVGSHDGAAVSNGKADVDATAAQVTLKAVALATSSVAAHHSNVDSSDCVPLPARLDAEEQINGSTTAATVSEPCAAAPTGSANSAAEVAVMFPLDKHAASCNGSKLPNASQAAQQGDSGSKQPQQPTVIPTHGVGKTGDAIVMAAKLIDAEPPAYSLAATDVSRPLLVAGHALPASTAVQPNSAAGKAPPVAGSTSGTNAIATSNSQRKGQRISASPSTGSSNSSSNEQQGQLSSNGMQLLDESSSPILPVSKRFRANIDHVQKQHSSANEHAGLPMPTANDVDKSGDIHNRSGGHIVLGHSGASNGVSVAIGKQQLIKQQHHTAASAVQTDRTLAASQSDGAAKQRQASANWQTGASSKYQAGSQLPLQRSAAAVATMAEAGAAAPVSADLVQSTAHIQTQSIKCAVGQLPGYAASAGRTCSSTLHAAAGDSRDVLAGVMGTTVASSPPILLVQPAASSDVPRKGAGSIQEIQPGTCEAAGAAKQRAANGATATNGMQKAPVIGMEANQASAQAIKECAAGALATSVEPHEAKAPATGQKAAKSKATSAVPAATSAATVLAGSATIAANTQQTERAAAAAETAQQNGSRPPSDSRASPAIRAATCGEGSGCFSLPELLAVVVDVMNSKRQEDERRAAVAQPLQVPLDHFHRYVAAKVHGDPATYKQALAAIGAGLEQHKQHQPEVAMFCAVLSGDINEVYMQQHMQVKSHLQQLAIQVATQYMQQQPTHNGHKQPLCTAGQHSQSTGQPPQQPEPSEQPQYQQQQPPQQQQQPTDIQPASWDQCCNAMLDDQQLLSVLNAWAKQRPSRQTVCNKQDEKQLMLEWCAAIRRHCGCSGGKWRADGVVNALLLWELQQHVALLKPITEAFKLADKELTGTLNLAKFKEFCGWLNDGMPEEEVLLLFNKELDKGGHGQVSFNTICSCLLPVMS
eukprot:GHRR01009824.1.p1 GENE.GHRR01009824.1~~GHRR01009824.1.p1  ORF type:complete len:1773 (+),score=827.00 GHRR01009824.1:534-5852(+)